MSLDIGGVIKSARTRKGVSLTHVASLLGVSRQAVAMYERSTANVRLGTLLRLADVLGYTLSELLRGGLPDPQTDTTQDRTE